MGGQARVSQQRPGGPHPRPSPDAPARPAVHGEAHDLLGRVRRARVERDGLERPVGAVDGPLSDGRPPGRRRDGALRRVLDERAALAEARRDVARHVDGLQGSSRGAGVGQQAGTMGGGGEWHTSTSRGAPRTSPSPPHPSQRACGGKSVVCAADPTSLVSSPRLLEESASSAAAAAAALDAAPPAADTPPGTAGPPIAAIASASVRPAPADSAYMPMA